MNEFVTMSESRTVTAHEIFNNIVYDSSLEKPIYNAYGVEKEFESYFDPVFSLREEFYDWRKQ